MINRRRTVEIFYRNGCITSVALDARSYEVAVDVALQRTDVQEALADYFADRGRQPSGGWPLSCGVRGHYTESFNKKVIHRRF